MRPGGTRRSPGQTPLGTRRGNRVVREEFRGILLAGADPALPAPRRLPRPSPDNDPFRGLRSPCHGASPIRDGTVRALAVPILPTSRRERRRLRSRGRRLQDGGAIAPHCPFLMQGPSPVLASPGGQASRWLVVLFEVPLAPAPLLLPRSPLVLPPATPGEELRPVAPVPWPPLLLPLPWPPLLLPPPWPAANALPARPRLKPVTPAVPARPSARQETPATRSLRMDVLRSRTRTAERAPVRPSRAAVRTFSARDEATRRRRNGSADSVRAFGRNRSIDPLPRRSSGTKEVIKASERSPLPCRCPTYRKVTAHPRCSRG